MKITFLGSAAAEGVPAFWCGCATCREARRRRGKDIRKRTAYLVDGDTLVDFGPDIYSELLAAGVASPDIRNLVFTHRHSDHLLACDLSWRRPGFCGTFDTLSPLRILSSRKVWERIVDAWNLADGGERKPDEYYAERYKLELHWMAGGDTVSVPGLSVRAADANHDPGGEPLVQALTRDGKTVLFCHDSGLLSETALGQLAGLAADAVIVDCTGAIGCSGWRDHHLCSDTVPEQIANLRSVGALKPDCRLCVNHYSHNGAPLQAEMEAHFAPLGITVGYDGMVLEV